MICRWIPLSLAAMTLFACSDAYSPDIQGHRGCRGHLPENTLPAFLRAIDMGVTTLEMDVVISRDNQVVVSHEPFLSHEICLDPDGKPISAIDEEKYNLYQMTYEEIEACDCGSTPHAQFQEQEKMVISKPLLRGIIDSVEAYVKTTDRPAIRYNIETKSSISGDDIFHPTPEPFVELLVAICREKKILDRLTIQSFDIRTLQVAHQKYPDIPLSLLVGNETGLEANLSLLGFTPQVYSPHFSQVDQALIDLAHAQGMQVIPWTLNDHSDIQKMIKLRVDGIISDYPDRVIELVK